ncbi:hypothetical protein QCA50_017055 [Cerrena zonata]|uniref:Photosystem II protein I n=1 Tax=Cerrena zonata TaxID=2478898 RepID=A0AAW0FH34_9APHY
MSFTVVSKKTWYCLLEPFFIQLCILIDQSNICLLGDRRLKFILIHQFDPQGFQVLITL